VFQVLNGTVAIGGVTIEHGLASDGGGLLNSGGKVTLTSDSVVNNLAIGDAGSDGANGAAGAAVGGDRSAGGNGGSAEGGDILNAAGSLILNSTFVSCNQAIGGTAGNGGIGIGAGGISGTNWRSGVGGDGGAGGSVGAGLGGGVLNAAGASLTLNGT
jgi:hypothetical protein